MNQIGFQPSFKSTTLLAGYHNYTNGQKDTVDKVDILKTFHVLEKNKNNDFVCITPVDKDSDDLRMTITEKRNGWSWSDSWVVSKDDNFETLMDAYKESHSKIETAMKQHDENDCILDTGAFADYIV